MSVGDSAGFAVYRGRTPVARVKRLLNPRNYLKLLTRIRATWPRRLVVLRMALVLHFRPQSVHRYSTQKLLPSEERRLDKTSDPRDDFGVYQDRTSEIPPLGRVTVIQKGASFDPSRLDELPGPIYAVNWTAKLDREDVIYTTADYGYLIRYVEKGMFPLLYLEICRYDPQGNFVPRDAGLEIESYLDDPRIDRISLYHNAGPQHVAGMPATSGLATVVALSLFAQDIEVYGWDFYLPFTPAKAGYWKSFLRTFVNFRMELQSQFVEMSIYNWHYAYRFSQLPGFKNHGHLSGLEKHPGINKRLDRVFYNV